MTDVSAIARANAISVEAKLVRHSKRADGGINIGLAIHPHGIPQALIDAQLGDRFMVALVQIDEHEQPVQQPKEDAHKQNPEPAPALPQTPARARKSSPPQRCALLCFDPSFWAFLNKTYHSHMPAGCGIQDKDGAASLIRFLCDVDSRSEIIPGTPAFDKWDAILSRYVGWSAADQYVEVLSPTHWRTIEGPSE